MSRKTVQRFCDNDLRKNKDLKRKPRIRKIATRFGNHGTLQCTISLLARPV
ncbi:hypothetical protein ACU8KI_18585 [Rhizobium leguminosarum]|uniref:hypothetical protein n=1 Tax=Rhizobium leguminosarum TaxID=384 RepID=UPI00293DB02B|nr:hypothetical protein [Rhizobium leguminosarum]MDV4165161.1 hypothetical protein [Rhizobium leguminosarum]MDV4175141.1 hypothetical protein [Rhizobium leguminosarum]